jgi:hypothetical protein
MCDPFGCVSDEQSVTGILALLLKRDGKLLLSDAEAMTTSDGISTDDWDRVHELSVDLFNAVDADKETVRAALLQYLDQLEEKYGLLASIVATRADFVDDSHAKRLLLHQAYELAQTHADGMNTLFVAHSLAEYYLEEAGNVIDGGLWLERFRKHLIDTPDDHLADSQERLTSKLNELIRGRR